jgi:hypothetical protein
MKLVRVASAAAGVVLCFASSARADAFSIAVDTSALAGGVYTLDFYLTDGSGAVNTSVSIDQLLVDGGALLSGTAASSGSVSGDAAHGITLDDGSFFSQWQQQFTAGSQLTFNLSLGPSSVDAPFPDAFGFALDGVPTTDLLGGNLLYVEFSSLHPSPELFNMTDSGGAIIGGVSAVPAPVPEPPAALLLLTGVAIVGLMRWSGH